MAISKDKRRIQIIADAEDVVKLTEIAEDKGMSLSSFLRMEIRKIIKREENEAKRENDSN